MESSWSPSPDQTKRLTEAALLILIGRGAQYGYAMRDSLNTLGVGDAALDSSTLYRTLRRLEKNGYVRSSWKRGDLGPKRRVYQVTEAGLNYLAAWHTHLIERRDCINTMIAACESLPIKEE